VYYTSIASIINPDYFKTCLYHDDPLSGCQRVGRSLRPPRLTGRPSFTARPVGFAAWELCGQLLSPCKGHCWRIHLGM